MPQDFVYGRRSGIDDLIKISGPYGAAGIYLGAIGINLHLYGEAKIAELEDRHDVTSVAELRYVRDSFVRPVPRMQSTIGVAQDPELGKLELYAGAQFGGEYLGHFGALLLLVSVAWRFKRN